VTNWVRSQVSTLGLSISLAGFILPTVGWAAEPSELSTIDEAEPASLRAADLQVQQPETQTFSQTVPGTSQPTPITSVKLQPNPKGLEIVLETPAGRSVSVDASKFRTQGNSLIADIPGTVLQLPEAQEFRAEKPTTDIAAVTVIQADTNTVRVSVTGNNALPKSDVSLKIGAFAYSLNPETEQTEEEIVVTGEQGGYGASQSNVGTRTNTPIRDVPQAIQVIPQQVLKDQAASDITDVLRNLAGVSPTTAFGGLTVRGFSGNIQRDGFSQGGAFGFGIDYRNNIEQVELLRGPASVLYGSGSPGGTLNLTEKQPLTQPRYELGATIGNFNFYRGTVDLTGPLNSSKTILYRLNVDYENAGSFIDFGDREDFAIFPIISFQISKNTKLTVEGGYQRQTDSSFAVFSGLPFKGTLLPNPVGKIPRSQFLGEPDFDTLTRTDWRIGYLLEHRFSDDWSLRNRFRYNYAFAESRRLFAIGDSLQDNNRTLDRGADESKETAETYTSQAEIVGKFRTGNVKHDLLFGLELRREISDEAFGGGTQNFPIDIFRPVYGNFFNDSKVGSASVYTGDTIGVYAQNLLSIGNKLKILLGGRFDRATNRFVITVPEQSSGTDEPVSGFAPRVGIVYQPIQPVSLYAGWSRSFEPQFGQDREGNSFVPITGSQFEVGIKTELLEGKLAATLAAYQITRQNDFQPDPVDPVNFSIQVGEQRSRGIDFSLSGEPLPGLRLIAGYAYIDATVTKDDTGLEGNLLANVPQHSANFWAVYEIQRGNLKGLGLGAGVFVLGERQGNTENTIKLPAYTLTNALLYYRRNNWRVQMNFENLFNVEYFTSIVNGAIPGAPFTVKGTVSVTF
jgi:iron complex outermembrane recepter protein